jgi:predicted SprT family Zn-dependent metalloprotease
MHILERIVRKHLKKPVTQEVLRKTFDACRPLSNLKGWSVRVTNMRKRAGLTKFGVRRIEFAKLSLSKFSKEEIIDLFLHELAHAILPPQQHTRTWSRLHKKLGGTGAVRCRPFCKPSRGFECKCAFRVAWGPSTPKYCAKCKTVERLTGAARIQMFKKKFSL